MYLVGKIADKANEVGGLVIKSAIYGSNIPSDELILANAVNQFGGDGTDYVIYKMDSTSTDGVRIVNGDEFSLIVDDTDTITSVGFALEDVKKWLNTTVDKSIVKKDGIDFVTVRTEMLLADKSGIDTSFNETILVEILTPAGLKPLYATFTNGVCSYPFQPTDHSNSTGNYKIPENKVDGYRVEQFAEFKAVIPVG